METVCLSGAPHLQSGARSLLEESEGNEGEGRGGEVVVRGGGEGGGGGTHRNT